MGKESYVQQKDSIESIDYNSLKICLRVNYVVLLKLLHS